MAFANYCRDNGIDFQTSVLFVAQDIDYLVACMCYIQLSFLGCPGYVVVGNTITEPATSHDARGLLPVDRGNVWYTPMYFSRAWTERRTWYGLDQWMQAAAADTKAIEAPTFKTTDTGQISIF